MELFITFIFSNPMALISYLLNAIPIIIYNILLFLAVKKDRQEFRKAKMMTMTCLVAIILSVAYIFVPGIGATNVSQEESEILSIIFNLYNAGYIIPYIITQGVILLMFGIKNKEKYNYFIFVAGLLLTINYTYVLTTYPFISNYEVYMAFILLFTVLRFINFAVLVTAYVFLLIQGIKYRQNLFIALGITMGSFRIVFYFLFPFIMMLATGSI
ncbi:MAG: hypothetical protein KGD72_10470 [Candidatus Lokiarchaeota archaeon]|nr:hypothetical protein [Candidatus Lokiarchaeota archaeon]